jgi:hypothetical protein
VEGAEAAAAERDPKAGAEAEAVARVGKGEWAEPGEWAQAWTLAVGQGSASTELLAVMEPATCMASEEISEGQTRQAVVEVMVEAQVWPEILAMVDRVPPREVAAPEGHPVKQSI